MSGGVCGASCSWHQAATTNVFSLPRGTSRSEASARTSVSRARTKAASAISRSLTATSRYAPVITRLTAIATSQADATYAPKRVHLVRIASPTIISMTPTMCMKVCPLNGSIFSASGLMYACQLAKRLKYLSSHARKGPTPSPIRRSHHD